MQNNNYKLIGVIDTLNMFPDFVRPVFKKEEKYYFQYGKNGVIYTFKEIPKEMNNRILKISSINISTNIELKENYSQGDDPVICFRIDKDTYFISDIDNSVAFIKTIETEDEMLKEEIDTFVDCVNRKNYQKKMLIKQKN